ncbi:MAG: hypothetical protein JWL90_4667 [Chthoniobacteraceae bacterium]|nr:hypothetical protein [Chthoniobacteraceae bacterium]
MKRIPPPLCSIPLLSGLCAVAFQLLTAATAPGEEEPKPAIPELQLISPGVYQIGKLRVDKNLLTVTIPATLNMEEGNLEYLLVSRKGSTHESLLVSDVEPSQLHFAMLLLGAKGAGILTPAPGDAPPGQINAEYLKHAPRLKGDSVSITAKWTQKGETKSAPVEDWLLGTNTNKPPARGPWTYTGSMFSNDVFLAQSEGCFVALIINPSALINNPRKDNDNDQVWVPRKKVIPPRDTPVDLVFKLEPAKTP